MIGFESRSLTSTAGPKTARYEPQLQIAWATIGQDRWPSIGSCATVRGQNLMVAGTRRLLLVAERSETAQRHWCCGAEYPHQHGDEMLKVHETGGGA